MSSLIEYTLYRLLDMRDFKMWSDASGNRYIEAGGERWDISSDQLEPAIVQAYIGISARIQAKELVKSAKVMLP